MILTVHFSFSSVLVFIFGVFVGIIWGAYIYVKRKKKLIVSHIDKKFTTLDVDKQKEVNDLVNNIYLIHKTTHKGPHKFLFGFVKIRRRKNKKNDELINKINILANELQVSPYMIFISAYFIQDFVNSERFTNCFFFIRFNIYIHCIDLTKYHFLHFSSHPSYSRNTYIHS